MADVPQHQWNGLQSSPLLIDSSEISSGEMYEIVELKNEFIELNNRGFIDEETIITLPLSVIRMNSEENYKISVLNIGQDHMVTNFDDNGQNVVINVDGIYLSRDDGFTFYTEATIRILNACESDMERDHGDMITKDSCDLSTGVCNNIESCRHCGENTNIEIQHVINSNTNIAERKEKICTFDENTPKRVLTSLDGNKPRAAPSSKLSNPSTQSSMNPSKNPSQPLHMPTQSVNLSNEPSLDPSVSPSVEPLKKPSDAPLFSPASESSITPSLARSDMPSREPSSKPSSGPSKKPSDAPSFSPSSKST